MSRKFLEVCQFFQENSGKFYCLKSVRIRSYSGPYFPAFALNTERYSLSLRIQFECGNIRTRITSSTDTFHLVIDDDSLKIADFTTKQALSENFIMRSFLAFFLKKVYVASNNLSARPILTALWLVFF